jgi:modulator of FtsH protease
MTHPSQWQGFAEMVGSASGALTGLLFVAISLNASRISGHQGLWASGAQTLIMFLTPLIVAAILLAPGQPGWVVGAELIAAGLASGFALLSVGRLKRDIPDEERGLTEIFNRREANVLVMMLFVAAGVILDCGPDWGLYLVLPAVLVAFISGVLNAWLFLVPPQRDRKHRDASVASPQE